MSAPAPVAAGRIPPAVVAELFRELGDLAASGPTPAEAVAALRADAESPLMASLLGELAADLEREPSLARVLERHVQTFSRETVALIEAAEKHNAVAEALTLLADDHERRQRAGTGRLFLALSWPLFLLLFLALIGAILLIFVIPAFKEVFTSFGADLPGPTLAVIAIADCAVEYWWVLLALAIGLPAGVILARGRQSAVGMALDRAYLGLPGVRRLLVKLTVDRMVALLAGAAACGIPLGPAIAYLASTLRNQSLKAMIAALARDVEQGVTLSAAWRKHAVLPRRTARMIASGERSGRLAPALARAGRIHAVEAMDAAAVFRQTLFVTTYVLTGIMVAFVVIAMYLPIFRMGSVV